MGTAAAISQPSCRLSPAWRQGELLIRPATALDWITLIRQGIPSVAVDSSPRRYTSPSPKLAAAWA